MTKDTMFSAGSVKFGIAPSGWSNDDFQDVDIGIPFGQIVSEMALAGFEGSSRGHKYPTDTTVLKHELDMRNLKITEPWVSTYFTIKDMHEQTVNNFNKEIKFLQEMKSGDMVLAELGGSSHQQPIALVPNAPKFTQDQWKLLANGLNELGHKANCQGISMCYHHHMGTGVMTTDEIAHLAELTDPKCVCLCLDTGHLHFAGGNNLDFIESYSDRIKHVHLKNIRQEAMDYSLANNLSFKEAILRGVFTVPGDPEGCIDFKSILQALADKNFKGWLVVEAEQNPAKATPLVYAQMARKYLKEVTGQ